MSTSFEQFGGALAGCRARHAGVGLEHIVELALDGQHRIQRIHRALEHHGDLAPAEAAQGRVVEGEHVAPVEQDLAAVADEGRRAVQAADGEGDGALAATGFAGEAEELARADVEAHILDGMEIGRRRRRSRSSGCGSKERARSQLAASRSDEAGPAARACLPVRRRGLAISSMAKLISARPRPSTASATQGESRSHQAPTESAEAFCAL